MRLSILIVLLVLGLLSAPAVAQTYDWKVCEGRLGPSGPELSNCQSMKGRIDPQGREIWVTARVPASSIDQGDALRIAGTASSEAWLGGVFLGANGRPGDSARSEIPGRYEVEYPLPRQAAGREGIEITVRLSSFHGGARLAQPMSAIKIVPARDALMRSQIAVNLSLFGILLASTFGFGVIHRLRRTRSSLLLTGMAASSAMLAALEVLPFLVHYAYPFHLWRLVGLWLLTATFSVLLVIYCTLGLRPPIRHRLMWGAAIAAALVAGFTSFDLKILGTLGVAVVVAIAAWALGPRRQPSAGIWLYLGSALTLAVVSLAFFAELFHLLLIASLLVPMLMLQVTRVARDDLSREQAFARAASPPDRLAVTAGRRVTIVAVPDIVVIRGADDYVEVVLLDGRRLLHSGRLDHLEAELPSTFMRVHRSAIANLQHAEGLNREGGNWRLMMRACGPVRVSRSRIAEIRSALLPATS
ncbi:MAG TPA: LytTR family DNA-binding domain-containing protein [Brevundimonas sp.]|uniref:LytR/AlgR family response regulator transcription factor n=1 Tax=Brevundimonas sp. TaxID=1871086 RepID=UPI0026273545|nr:LytTR family DNA-binding domain-containing protein [Brevundimonas sp.]HRO33992.1 LytTR family DNA-binding domain-containing protein [Brevundimonas sp.]